MYKCMWLLIVLLLLMACGTINPAVPSYPTVLAANVDLTKFPSPLEPEPLTTVLDHTVFLTPDTPQEVIAWYRQVLKSAGWSNIREPDVQLLRADSYKDCANMYSVQVAVQATDKGTVVYVLHEQDHCR